VMHARLRTEPDDNAQARRERAYRNYCDELSRAWQRGRTDPRAATAVGRLRPASSAAVGGGWRPYRPEPCSSKSCLTSRMDCRSPTCGPVSKN
jgi:hypothetical protein